MINQQPDFNKHQDVSQRRLRVFLCHSSGDRPVVRNLYQRLKAHNIDPWLDKENLLPGQEWEHVIRKAVRATDIVIVCLSCGSINKTGFVQKEIKLALDVYDEQPEGSIFLIPLKLEECKLPDRLKKFHEVNLFEEDGINKLMKALISKSESFDEKLLPINFPKENISTKEDALRYLSDEHARRIITVEEAKKVCEIVGVAFPKKLIIYWKDAHEASTKHRLNALDNEPGEGVWTYKLSDYVIGELGLTVDRYSGIVRQVRANREALAKKFGIS